MHDADELCDRVAFIVNGEIRAEGAPKYLKKQFGQPLLTVEYENNGLLSGDFPLTGLASNDSFQEILQKYPIVSLHSKEASLDEVFIKTTGQKLHSMDN